MEEFAYSLVAGGDPMIQSLSSLSAIGATPGSATDTKSPKVFGLPKPYTGLYSASSYMANRPSYMRTREPGQYTIGATSASSSPGSATSTPSYSKLPGVNAPPPGGSSATLPGSRTLPDIPRTTSAVAARSLPRKGPTAGTNCIKIRSSLKTDSQ